MWGREGVRTAALAAALLLAAAGWAAAADLPWRHGVLEAKSDAGIYVMVNQGFAQKDGVTPDLVQFKSDSIALRALIAGAIDSYDGTSADTVSARAHGSDPELSLPMDKINWMATELVQQGILKEPYDMTKMIDPSVREAALKRLGKS